MNPLLRLYRFLGSIFFTLILFSFIILVSSVGTFLESMTESHRYAEQWTYGHPLFFTVFLSLFANILFSATRRWPFQKRHIPFLMTHLGLLLLLSGVWIKGAYGLQGHMNLLEGSGSHHVILPGEQMIRLRERQGTLHQWHIARTFLGNVHARPLASMQPQAPYLELMDLHPHGKQQLEMWNQKKHFTLLGMEPIAAGQTQLRAISETPWLFRMEKSIYPVEQINKRVEALYSEDATLLIHQAGCDAPLYIGSLHEAMKGPLSFSQGLLHIHLEKQESPSQWQLRCTWSTQEGGTFKNVIPLSGEESLQTTDRKSVV